MKRAIAAIVIAGSAYTLQLALDWVLPMNTPRFWVIALGGVLALVWSALIFDPIKKWGLGDSA